MGHQALCEPVTQIDRLLLAEAMSDARPDLIIALSQHAVSAYLENYNKPTHAGALVLALAGDPRVEGTEFSSQWLNLANAAAFLVAVFVE